MNTADNKATELVCQDLSEEEAARYRRLLGKNQEGLTSEEREWMLKLEREALQKSLDRSAKKKRDLNQFLRLLRN